MFALLDCNNFFASCERVFRPELAKTPIVVLSNNDGCVIARSQEAKALGIAMGAAVHLVKPLIQRYQVRVFSANFELYGDLSNRVFSLLQQSLSPKFVEIYSIDEAFLDLSTLEPMLLLDFCQDLRKQIYQWTGIPVSIGIGQTKTLAKVAAGLAKKNTYQQKASKHSGVFSLATLPCHNESQDSILAQVPVQDIWGIGFRLTPALQGRGIETAYDLKYANDAVLLKRYGSTLLRTVWELRGTVCYPLKTTHSLRKSIVCSRSFGQMVESFTDLMQAVATYTARATEKLREDDLQAGCITVSIRTNRFRPDEKQYRASHSIRLSVPSDDTPTLIQAARQCLEHIYQPGFLYHKAGILLQELTLLSARQQDLFEVPSERSPALMKTLDTLNKRHGHGSIRFASEGLTRPWWMKQSYRSPCYSSRWEERPRVQVNRAKTASTCCNIASDSKQADKTSADKCCCT